ncbi:MAG TPA: histidine phosphatase family protein [Chthonomonadaceae bacterium]|nr:histidine phosphatase family protein [Chthonomonadaceae bacterium]
MSSDSLRLYLVRHGVTAWNRQMRMQGHTDVPLDEEGLEQARRIARRLASEARPPQAVWSSDLLRARQTAEAIAAPLGLTVQTTPLLRETMLGEWEGLTRAEIEARGDGEHLARYILDSHKYRPPGGETLEAAWERMVRAAAEIRAQHPRGQVAIVGHGGSLRVLLCEALDAPIASLRRLWLDNASLSVIEQYGDPCNPIRRVTLLNDTSHLRCE